MSTYGMYQKYRHGSTVDFSYPQVVVTATTVVPRESNRSNSVGLFVSVAADDNDVMGVTASCCNRYGAHRSIWKALRQWIMSPWAAKEHRTVTDGTDTTMTMRGVGYGPGSGYHYANASTPVLTSPWWYHEGGEVSELAGDYVYNTPRDK